MKRLKISTGGQVSVPATIRKRWGTRTVVLDDRGDHAVLRPAPDDPIEAAKGAFAAEFERAGLTSDRLREQAREDETIAEQRRHGAPA